jgi:hypothetical protein
MIPYITLLFGYFSGTLFLMSFSWDCTSEKQLLIILGALLSPLHSTYSTLSLILLYIIFLFHCPPATISFYSLSKLQSIIYTAFLGLTHSPYIQFLYHEPLDCFLQAPYLLSAVSQLPCIPRSRTLSRVFFRSINTAQESHAGQNGIAGATAVATPTGSQATGAGSVTSMNSRSGAVATFTGGSTTGKPVVVATVRFVGFPGVVMPYSSP